MTAARLLTCLCGAAFLVYGIRGLTLPSIAEEFKRFGLPNLRVLTGVLEILGGAGLLIGLHWLPVLVISAAGLALLMLIAFALRLRMRDSVQASLPSLALTGITLYILLKALRF